jgi:tetratricopeptide (TPR) repeat protein
MTSSGRRLEQLAHLEEERDFLLRSLDDLEREYAAGDLDEDEFRTLRDDYTRRAAEVVRAIEADRPEVERPPRRDARRWWLLAGVAALAVVAGVVIAQASGRRPPGGTITGDIDSSTRTRVNNAETLFAAGDLEAAMEVLDEVLADDPDLAEALLLSAQIHEQRSDPLAAIQSLDRILETDPEHIDALTLRGWILVNIPDETTVASGLASLDAAIALEPRTFDPYIFRGYVARVLEGDLEAAIGYYEQALERAPPPQMVSVFEGVIEEMRAELEARTAEE